MAVSTILLLAEARSPRSKTVDEHTPRICRNFLCHSVRTVSGFQFGPPSCTFWPGCSFGGSKLNQSRRRLDTARFCGTQTWVWTAEEAQSWTHWRRWGACCYGTWKSSRNHKMVAWRRTTPLDDPNGERQLREKGNLDAFFVWMTTMVSRFREWIVQITPRGGSLVQHFKAIHLFSF